MAERRDFGKASVYFFVGDHRETFFLTRRLVLGVVYASSLDKEGKVHWSEILFETGSRQIKAYYTAIVVLCQNGATFSSEKGRAGWVRLNVVSLAMNCEERIRMFA